MTIDEYYDEWLASLGTHDIKEVNRVNRNEADKEAWEEWAAEYYNPENFPLAIEYDE